MDFEDSLNNQLSQHELVEKCNVLFAANKQLLRERNLLPLKRISRGTQTIDQLYQ